MKLWAGRFQKATEGIVDDFQASISFDQRLYEQDITGSIAHAAMLKKQGILSDCDEVKIRGGLQAILADIKDGEITFPATMEDIHMFVENTLTDRIGEAGKRLHTGRSRNDQVALDFRMYAKIACTETVTLLKELCDTLLLLASENVTSIMPGYTHLQLAQPVTLAHHLMAYFQMFTRDIIRFKNAYISADVMPLGSGALAAAPYPLDREYVANQLGFSAVTENSMDGVSDRDFALDYIYAASVCMMHLSRFCEEIVLWSSHEFSFIVIDDGFATGSSMMPQKKNPDVAELIRGKTGRVYGDLTALLTVMKGLPLTYNKDMQEDKESFFDACDTVLKCLRVFCPLLTAVRFRVDVMEKDAAEGFINATDCADYLVRKNIPFREAHEIIGKLVSFCIENNCTLCDVSVGTLKTFSNAFEEDVYDSISLSACINARNIRGGPAPEQVKASIMNGHNWLKNQ